jgi:hypothetical protein
MVLSTRNRDPEQQKQLQDETSSKNFVAGIREIQKRVAKFPIIDVRAPQEILYDENGIPK